MFVLSPRPGRRIRPKRLGVPRGSRLRRRNINHGGSHFETAGHATMVETSSPFTEIDVHDANSAGPSVDRLIAAAEKNSRVDRRRDRSQPCSSPAATRGSCSTVLTTCGCIRDPAASTSPIHFTSVSGGIAGPRESEAVCVYCQPTGSSRAHRGPRQPNDDGKYPSPNRQSRPTCNLRARPRGCCESASRGARDRSRLLQIGMVWPNVSNDSRDSHVKDG